MGEPALLHERISRFFSRALNVDVPSVDTDLFETGVLDSLAFVDLLLHLEREFGVTTSVSDLEPERFASIARIAAFVASRNGGATPATGSRADVELSASR
jgi:D-alanine--poly(phosphoribitol) ligase subunit 2